MCCLGHEEQGRSRWTACSVLVLAACALSTALLWGSSSQAPLVGISLLQSDTGSLPAEPPSVADAGAATDGGSSLGGQADAGQPEAGSGTGGAWQPAAADALATTLPATACQAGVAQPAPVSARDANDTPARDLFVDPGPTLFYLKTPKTAGESFSTDIHQRALRRLGKNLVHLEGCYRWHRNWSRIHPGSVVTLARNPREHVMSQYWHCKSSKQAALHAGAVRALPPFEDWVRKWTHIRANCSHFGDFAPYAFKFGHVDHFKTYTPFKCYHPINMQSHRFTCRKPFLFPENVDMAAALTNMRAAWFVGIMEFYQESLCLFMARILQSPLPPGCDSRNQAAWGNFSFKHDTHGVSHSHKTVWEEPPEILEQLDRLIALDLVLYRAARLRLLQELDEVERVRGVKILSDQKRHALIA